MEYLMLVIIGVLCIVAVISTMLIDEIIQRGIYAILTAIYAICKLFKRT